MTISSTSSSFRPGICTSSTRPTNPYEGQIIYETDTDKVLAWNGSAWYPNWNLPWGIIVRVEGTTATSFGGLTVNLTTPSFSVLTGRLYKITYFEPESNISSNAYSVTTILDTVANATILSGLTTQVANLPNTINVSGIMTFSTKTLTLQARNQSNVGGTNLNRTTSRKAYLMCEDIGPA